jgi:hypothetical protein
MGVMAVRQYQVESERWSMLEREADVATAESRVAAYRDDIGDVAAASNSGRSSSRK